MFHLVARALPHRMLWWRDTDGLALFLGVHRAFPELVALCVMPDHVHLILPHADPQNRMHRALAGYARGLCARRGIRGPLWETRPPAQPISGPKHVRRTIRYVHLNPCRAELVVDPLAWPFSTHRDACGLVAPPVIAVVPDPASFHRFVSADPAVDVSGTPFPVAPYERVPIDAVAAAAAAIWRQPLDVIFERSAARRAFVRVAVHLGHSPAEIAAATGLSGTGRRRIAKTTPPGRRVYDPVLRAILATIGDRRFAPLDEGDHRRERAWQRYAHRR